MRKTVAVNATEKVKMEMKIMLMIKNTVAVCGDTVPTVSSTVNIGKASAKLVSAAPPKTLRNMCSGVALSVIQVIT